MPLAMPHDKSTYTLPVLIMFAAMPKQSMAGLTREATKRYGARPEGGRRLVPDDG